MKALSLFSGIGGIDLACEWAGIETVAFCEREPFPQKVLKKHWPNIPIYDDVCTLTKERLDEDGIGTIDIIHGGYPCQPFSNAGKREGTEDDRHLWPEVFRLIQDIQPGWFVGENVAGHITLGLDNVLADLEGIGYSWETFVLPASAVDARHRRERVFIVAHSPSKGLPIGGQSRVSAYEAEARTRVEYQLERCGENVAHTKGQRCGKTWEYQSIRTKERSTGSSEIISHPYNTGLQGSKEAGDVGRSREEAGEFSSRHHTSGSKWAIEPPVGRVANGIPQRVDRLKALGNAVVPQQIYPILAAIKQINDMLKEESA